MKVLLNLCLLFSLISPVLLLICKDCLNRIGTKCPQEVNQKCPPDSACSTTIFSSNLVYNRTMAEKSCTPSASCAPGYYSFTTSGGGFMKMLVDCCTKYICNKKPLEFSSQPMELNGLECEGCQNQGTCDGAEVVKCLGDQTKCISMSIYYFVLGSMGGRVFNAKGCGTPLMCDNQNWKKNSVFDRLLMTTIEVNCTDAILSPSVSSLAEGAIGDSHS